MELNKIPFRFLLCVIAVFFLASGIYAQTETIEEEEKEIANPNAGHYVESREFGTRLYQRIVWEKEVHATRYEVVIQVALDGFWREHRRTVTRYNYISVSLPPGRYRYNVAPFDMLGNKIDPSDWIDFYILAGYIPKIERFTPDIFYLDIYLEERVLYIAGVNLIEDTKVYLRNSQAVITPIEVVYINDRRLKVVFDEDDLFRGVFEVVVENPGQLDSVLHGFSVGYQKPLDIFFKMAYTPFVPVYGDLKEYVGTDLYFSGFSMGIEAVSSQRGLLHYGFEFSSTFHFASPMTTVKMNYPELVDDFTLPSDSAFYADVDFIITFQRRFNSRKNILTARFGCGFTLLNYFGSIYEDSSTIHVNIGASCFFLLQDFFYLDAGLDYYHYFGERAFGTIRPRLGMVWQY